MSLIIFLVLSCELSFRYDNEEFSRDDFEDHHSTVDVYVTGIRTYWQLLLAFVLVSVNRV